MLRLSLVEACSRLPSLIFSELELGLVDSLGILNMQWVRITRRVESWTVCCIAPPTSSCLLLFQLRQEMTLLQTNTG